MFFSSNCSSRNLKRYFSSNTVTSIFQNNKPSLRVHKFPNFRFVSSAAATSSLKSNISEDDNIKNNNSNNPTASFSSTSAPTNTHSNSQESLKSSTHFFNSHPMPTMAEPSSTKEERYQRFCKRIYQQNMFSMKLGLTNITKALELENKPHLSHKRVFVAGTNGKGTVSSALSNILTARPGTKVGFFSSPHLVDFSERFRVNGRPVDKDTVQSIGTEVLIKYGGNQEVDDIKLESPHAGKKMKFPALDGSPREDLPVLTFFELATLMAVKIFEAEKCDIAIYEIGLGGRHDAVNGLQPPDLCLFATMGFDHMQYLGDTIEKITTEKAEIMTEAGAVVIGRQEYKDSYKVFDDYVAKRNCNRFDPGDYKSLHNHHSDEHIQSHLDTAITAAKEVFDATDDEIKTGLSKLRWPGRMQYLNYNNRDFLIDAAHNPDGVRVLMKAIKNRSNVKVKHAIFGVMKDKDFGPMLKELLANGIENIHATVIQNPRAAQKEDYEKKLEDAKKNDTNGADSDKKESQMIPENMKFASIGTLEENLASLPAAAAGETTLICGSIFLLGEFFQSSKLDVGSIWVD